MTRVLSFPLGGRHAARTREQRQRELAEVVDELDSAVTALDACMAVLNEQHGWSVTVGQMRSAQVMLRGIAETVRREPT